MAEILLFKEIRCVDDQSLKISLFLKSRWALCLLFYFFLKQMKEDFIAETSNHPARKTEPRGPSQGGNQKRKVRALCLL